MLSHSIRSLTPSHIASSCCWWWHPVRSWRARTAVQGPQRITVVHWFFSMAFRSFSHGFPSFIPRKYPWVFLLQHSSTDLLFENDHHLSTQNCAFDSSVLDYIVHEPYFLGLQISNDPGLFESQQASHCHHFAVCVCNAHLSRTLRCAFTCTHIYINVYKQINNDKYTYYNIIVHNSAYWYHLIHAIHIHLQVVKWSSPKR